MTYRNSLPLAGAPASSLPRQPAFLPLAAADTDDVATAPVSPTEGGDVRQPVQGPDSPGDDTQEVLPAAPGESTGGEALTPPGETEQGQESQMLQGGLSVPQPEQPSGSGPLLPFLSGMALSGALLLGAAALWIGKKRRNRRRARQAPPPARGTVRTASVHELGQRDSQQDAWGIAGSDAPELGVLAAVADGMGGLVNSGQVSGALIQCLTESFAPGGETPPAQQLQLLLGQAVAAVEDLLRDSTAQSGSTLVVCLIRSGGLSWLSVGDSRIYLWRSGGLVQLNQDHDFRHDLTLLALQGDLTLEEADRDPRRENLTSFIGRGFPRKVDWNPEPVELLPGDKVLLVSDGVYRALSQAELAACLEGGADTAADAIRTAVHKKQFPQQDNYTAVILAVGD